MHVETQAPPFGVGYVRTVVKLTKAERKALRLAASIAEAVRDHAHAVVGVAEWEGDPQDMTLAHVEHDARELAEAGVVVLREEWAAAGETVRRS